MYVPLGPPPSNIFGTMIAMPWDYNSEIWFYDHRTLSGPGDPAVEGDSSLILFASPDAFDNALITFQLQCAMNYHVNTLQFDRIWEQDGRILFPANGIMPVDPKLWPVPEPFDSLVFLILVALLRRRK